MNRTWIEIGVCLALLASGAQSARAQNFGGGDGGGNGGGLGG
jgi:hypothetical protein